MATFTLIHGAWHGAWAWDFVVPLLRDRGHRVTRPTLTGLGEKAHLLSSDITLQTFTDDLVEHLEDLDLTEVVLVGHSFGGNAITGAAAVVPGRIRELVYLDAMIAQSGVAPFALLDQAAWAQRKQAAMDSSGGLSMPCPPGASFGLSDAEQIGWVEGQLTAHPLRTYETSLLYDGPPGNDLPARYIVATNPPYPALATHLNKARELGWPIQEIASGHDCMVSDPDMLADLLCKGLVS